MPKLKPTTSADMDSMAKSLGVGSSHATVSYAGAYLCWLRNPLVSKPLKESFGLTADEADKSQTAAVEEK